MMRLPVLGLIAALLAGSAGEAAPLRPATEPPEPRFDRLYQNDEILGFLRGYARAYPKWVKLESLGEVTGGYETWLLTIHNPATGDELNKPAMYIDGATHANEVQGTETVLYLIDYVLKSYGRLEPITELLDRSVLYFVPIVNPDSRERWFTEPATPHYPRTVQVSIDDDRDGVADEDGYEDLDGDGIITTMRKKVPLGEGTHRLDPDEPRLLIEADADHPGDYLRLGREGIDNDGDGEVNEDTIGYVDPNRTWGYEWQPRYVQSGSTEYPFQIPESRNIALWAERHPNIAAAQSFHNSGGMILRGPGSKTQPPYPRPDIEVYDILGKEGELLLPGYRYMITWKDLYTAYGSTDDYFYGGLGAISFTNELYPEVQDFDGDGEVSSKERLKFADRLTLGRTFVDWKPFDHPQYGKIEIGGFRHDTGRVPEPWMLPEESHRNAAFVLFHASHLPKLSFGPPSVEPLGGGVSKVWLPVRNERAIPSMTAVARKLKLTPPDLVTVEGVKVLASGLADDAWLNQVDLQDDEPERLQVPGVAGLSQRTLFFLVEGSGSMTVRYVSVKGGRLSTRVSLSE